MEKRGIVSLWLGHVKSEEVLKSITTPAYSDDGDYIPSYFESRFGFEHPNEWTKEISFVDEPAGILEELLEGVSYNDVIIPRSSAFSCEREIADYNSVLLYYDLEYSTKVKIVNEVNCRFEFIGSVSYN